MFPHLALVSLRLGLFLYNADDYIDYAYFPNSGMSSTLAVTADGETVEAGMVGNEGMLGIQAVLGSEGIFCSAVVQIPGNAMRIRSEVLRHEFKRNPGLSKLLLDYRNDRHLRIGESAVCNRFHSLEQRLCRCMLTSQDCARSDSFPLSQAFLSFIIGAPRKTVILMAEALTEARLISYRGSHIRIIDREGMKRRTCDCYRTAAESTGQPAA
jgi:CRP-like cAMP-binding protein